MFECFMADDRDDPWLGPDGSSVLAPARAPIPTEDLPGNLSPSTTLQRTEDASTWTVVKQVTQTGSTETNAPINATWIKVTGAVPMDWTPLPRPFGIADITKTTESGMNRDQQAHRSCFAQLRITSGCNPARLTNSMIDCLNKSSSVTFERNVRAAGGTKRENSRNLDHDANGTATTKTDQVHLHTACTALSIKEGSSLKLATPLFQILPLICDATDCAAFLTSWKPCNASDQLAVPIYHIEPDQHEPEDPLHRSTARVLTTIAAHFQTDNEPKESTLGATRSNQTTPLEEQAFAIADIRQTHLPHSSQPRQAPAAAPRHLTIACVEITDTLAEDIIHTATCLSINAVILLFHITQHSDQSAHSSRNINTRGHIPFASGPVSAPFTIQHRGPTEFQVACDAFGVGMYDSDCKNPDDPSDSATADQTASNASPRISALGHHTLQAALDATQRANTKSDDDNTHPSIISKQTRLVSPHTNAQEHHTPPGILGIPQRTQNTVDANKHWVPVQGYMKDHRPTPDQQSTQAPVRTRTEQNGKVRRNRSTVNQMRAPETTPVGNTRSSIRGSTVKPTWRVKTADTNEATIIMPDGSSTHEALSGTPSTPTPTCPTRTHPNHSTIGNPKLGNTTNQEGLHRVQPLAHDHNVKGEPDSTTTLHRDPQQILVTAQMGTGAQNPVMCTVAKDAAVAAQTTAPQKDALHIETHWPARHANANRPTKTYSHTDPEGEKMRDPRTSNTGRGGMQQKGIKDFLPNTHPHQLPSVRSEQEHTLHCGQANNALRAKSDSPPRCRQIPQAASLKPGTPLTAAALAAAPPGLQKGMIGERLFAAIAKHKPELARKITGMLLEMDNSDLLKLLESETWLKSKVNEATQALGTGNEANDRQPLPLTRDNTNSTIPTLLGETPNASTFNPGPPTPRPIGGGTNGDDSKHIPATDQPHIDVPCPYTWAGEFYQHHTNLEPGTHFAYEKQLDQVYTNVAQAVDDIANKGPTHHPIGMGFKHLKHPTQQDEHRKDNEQHVPQFIIEILSFMTTATCQFTGCSRNRNNKDFLVLLDMVERLHESSPTTTLPTFTAAGTASTTARLASG